MAKKQTEDGPEPKKVYDVRVKPGHPQKMFHRAGLTFSETETVRLTELPDAVRDEPWLIVSPVEQSDSQTVRQSD